MQRYADYVETLASGRVSLSSCFKIANKLMISLGYSKYGEWLFSYFCFSYPKEFRQLCKEETGDTL